MNDKLLKLPLFIEVLITLYNNPKSNLQNISNNIRMTYAHANHIKNELVSKGLLKETKKGRELKMYLTYSGNKLAEHAYEIKRILEVADFEEKVNIRNKDISKDISNTTKTTT